MVVGSRTPVTCDVRITDGVSIQSRFGSHVKQTTWCWSQESVVRVTGGTTICDGIPRFMSVPLNVVVCCDGNVVKMSQWFRLVFSWCVLDCCGRVLGDTAIECYGCATSLPATTDQIAKDAMKMLIKNNYNLPEVHKVCNEPGDQEFPTIPHLECPTNDQCVKITVNQQDLHFVIRGCKATMFKPNITPQNYPCDDSSSPSICYCDQELCNQSVHAHFWLPTVLILSSLSLMLQIRFLN